MELVDGEGLDHSVEEILESDKTIRAARIAGGDRVAFASYRAGSEQVFVIEPDGSMTQPVTTSGSGSRGWFSTIRLFAFSTSLPTDASSPSRANPCPWSPLSTSSSASIGYPTHQKCIFESGSS
jgi:hypothetical protein